MDRRKFIKRTSFATVGVSLSDTILQKLFASTVKEYNGEIPKRVLGKTNEKVSIFGLGGWHIGNIKEEKIALEMIAEAYDLGVNFFDTAFSYNNGTSELRYGKAFKGMRDKIFLMSKSTQRKSADAKKELELTLKRLQTDYLDLWQLHSIKTKEEVDKIFSPGGAYETAVKAKEEGKIRYIGITGHYDPYANLEALKYHKLLDTIQMPINLVDPNYRSFINITLPKAVEYNLGIIAMKTIANGKIVEHKISTAKECLTYVWNLPVSVLVSGCDSPAQLLENITTAKSFKKLSKQEKESVLMRTKNLQFEEVEYYKNKE
ncbi:MAG: aldo/keto reductase [Chlorobi bacterium]|nr:aldo/keto reductase [Chlorobiota bacterium]